MSLSLWLETHPHTGNVLTSKCALFVGFVFHIHSAFAHGSSMWSGLWRRPAVWQVAGGSRRPRRLGGLRAALRVPGMGGGTTRWLRRASSIQVTPRMWTVQRDSRQRGEAGAADNGTWCPLALGQRGPKASVQRGAPHAAAVWSTRAMPANPPLAWPQVKSCTAQ